MSDIKLRLVGPSGLGEIITESTESKNYPAGTRAMFVVVDNTSDGEFQNKPLQITFDIIGTSGTTTETIELPYINTNSSGDHFFSCIWQRFSRISTIPETTPPSLTTSHTFTDELGSKGAVGDADPTTTSTSDSDGQAIIPNTIQGEELMWRMTWSNEYTDFISHFSIESATITANAPHGNGNTTELTNYTPVMSDLFDIVAIDGTFGPATDSKDWESWPYRADGEGQILRGNILKWKSEAHQTFWAEKIRYLTFQGGNEGNETHIVNLKGMSGLRELTIQNAMWLKKIQNFAEAGSSSSHFKVSLSNSFQYCQGDECSNNFDVLPDTDNQYSETLPFDAWPTNMHELNISGCGSVTKLVGLPNTLEELNVSYTSIGNLNDLGIADKSKITKLNISNTRTYLNLDAESTSISITGVDLNGFTSLEELLIERHSAYVPKVEFTPSSLPTSLKILQLNGQHVDTLSILPENLEELYLAGNKLLDLPKIPNTLKILTLGDFISGHGDVGNPLTNLTALTLKNTASSELSELKARNCEIFKVTTLVHFNNLKTIDVRNTDFDNGTLPNLPASVTEFDASQSNLTSADGLSECALKYLNISHNNIGDLTETHLTGSKDSLEEIQCAFAGLTALNLPNCTKLRDIYASNNKIEPTKISFSPVNSSLTGRSLYINNNGFSSFPDMSSWFVTNLGFGGGEGEDYQDDFENNLPNTLTALYISGSSHAVWSGLSNVNLSSLTNLITLSLGSLPELTGFSESKFPPNLTNLSLQNNVSLTGGTLSGKFDFTGKLNKLEYFYSYSTQIEQLVFGNKPELTHIIATLNTGPASSVGGLYYRYIRTDKNSPDAGNYTTITGTFPKLAHFYAENSELTALDLSSSPRLSKLCIIGNKITSLKLADSLEDLQYLYASHNDLTELPNLESGTGFLERVYFDHNKITNQNNIKTLIENIIATGSENGQLTYLNNPVDRKIPDTDEIFKTLYNERGWFVQPNTPSADAFEEVSETGEYNIPDSNTWGPRQIHVRFPASGESNKITVGGKKAEMSGSPGQPFKIKSTVWQLNEAGVNKRVRMGGFVFIRCTWHGYLVTSGTNSIQDSDNVEILLEITEIGEDETMSSSSETENVISFTETISPSPSSSLTLTTTSSFEDTPTSSSSSSLTLTTTSSFEDTHTPSYSNTNEYGNSGPISITSSSSPSQSPSPSQSSYSYGDLPSVVYLDWDYDYYGVGGGGSVYAEAAGKYTQQSDYFNNETAESCNVYGVSQWGGYYLHENGKFAFAYDRYMKWWIFCDFGMESTKGSHGAMDLLTSSTNHWAYFIVTEVEPEFMSYQLPSIVYINYKPEYQETGYPGTVIGKYTLQGTKIGSWYHNNFNGEYTFYKHDSSESIIVFDEYMGTWNRGFSYEIDNTHQTSFQSPYECCKGITSLLSDESSYTWPYTYISESEVVFNEYTNSGPSYGDTTYGDTSTIAPGTPHFAEYDQLPDEFYVTFTYTQSQAAYFSWHNFIDLGKYTKSTGYTNMCADAESEYHTKYYESSKGNTRFVYISSDGYSGRWYACQTNQEDTGILESSDAYVSSLSLQAGWFEYPIDMGGTTYYGLSYGPYFLSQSDTGHDFYPEYSSSGSY